MGLDDAKLFIGKKENPGSTYVAMSRLVTILGMWLQPFDMQRLLRIGNSKPVFFYGFEITSEKRKEKTPLLCSLMGDYLKKSFGETMKKTLRNIAPSLFERGCNTIKRWSPVLWNMCTRLHGWPEGTQTEMNSMISRCLDELRIFGRSLRGKHYRYVGFTTVLPQHYRTRQCGGPSRSSNTSSPSRDSILHQGNLRGTLSYSHSEKYVSVIFLLGAEPSNKDAIAGDGPPRSNPPLQGLQIYSR